MNFLFLLFSNNHKDLAGNVLINKSLKKQEETIPNSLKDMEERHRKEMDALHDKYKKDMTLLRNEMQDKFQEFISKIDTSRI